MNARLPIPAVLAATAILAFAPMTRAGGGPIYLAEKVNNYIQTKSSVATADPNSLFLMGLQSPIAARFALPGGAGVKTSPVSTNGDYEFYKAFATEAALNAAFPDGSYTVSGTSIPTTGFSFAGDLYPSPAPAIVGGTWLPGGVLVLNPAVSNRIYINTFSAYKTAGVAGEMQLQVNTDLATTSLGNVGNQVATRAVLSIPASATPFIAYTLPAHTLTSGGIYDIKLQYNTLTSLNTSAIANSAILSLYGSHTVAYVIAQSGTAATDTRPAITLQPANQTASLGGTATFSFGENYDSKTAVLFFQNGEGININSAHYFYDTSNPGLVQLTINDVTAADAGTYYAVFVNPGGVVESKAATLTTVVGVKPAVTIQPNQMENDTASTASTTAVFVNAGSTAVLTTVITGGPSYQWYRGTTPLSNSPGNATTNAISGATGPQLVIQGATSASNGLYTCKASNTTGTVTTAAATLTVGTTLAQGYLNAVSAQAFVGTSSSGNILISGFYISGTTSRTVLIQGLGPGLAGVTGALKDPSLSIHHVVAATNTDEIVAQNTGWTASGDTNETNTLLAVARSVNATVLTSGHADSELLVTLKPGAYTAEIQGASGDTGIAKIAIYQLN